MKNAMIILKELVGLLKAKKVIIKAKGNSSIKYYYCPNCHKLITINSAINNYLEENKFCKYCGQKLKV